MDGRYEEELRCFLCVLEIKSREGFDGTREIFCRRRRGVEGSSVVRSHHCSENCNGLGEMHYLGSTLMSLLYGPGTSPRHQNTNVDFAVECTPHYWVRIHETLSRPYFYQAVKLLEKFLVCFLLLLCEI